METVRNYKLQIHFSLSKILLCWKKSSNKDNFLPNFSPTDAVGWLEFVTDWEHFTRSAQLGPGCESRAAASVGGGPLKNKTDIILKKLVYDGASTLRRWDC